ncbi:LPD29 domain-containing protein [Nocardia salmonicida]|uniref:LPD29 domain-containing protein n=1 Tax=Nocardia salmonicida TaxID=53431 RepID=UPI0033EA4EA2
MTTTRVLHPAAVARRVRAALARRWPGVPFVVRAGRGDWINWVTVRWSDGPPAAAVEDITHRFGSLAHGHDAAGPVVFGIHGVLTDREITAAGYDTVAAAIERRCLVRVPRTDADAIDWTAAYPTKITTPIVLGPSAGTLAGIYGPGQAEPISLSRALAIVADAAELPPARPRCAPPAAAARARLLAVARRMLDTTRSPRTAGVHR